MSVPEKDLKGPLPWFKVPVNIIDDRELATGLTGDEFRCWIYVQAMARGSATADRIPGGIAEIAFRTRLPKALIKSLVKKLAKSKRLVLDGDAIVLPRFLEDQAKREKGRLRVKKHRDKEKEKELGNAGNGGCNATDVEGEGEGEGEGEIDEEVHTPENGVCVGTAPL